MKIPHPRISRRPPAICCLLLLLAGCDGAIAPARGEAAAGENADPLVARQWPVFRGNARSTGVAASPLPEKLELLWKFAVDDGAFEATPVIVDGVVYIGDLDGTFYALNLQSGEMAWKFINPAEKAGFKGAAAVRDGRVYLADIDGNSYCLDLKTHEKLWSAKAEGEIVSAPNFHKGNVLIGSTDAKLYCLDAKTGDVQWTHTIGDQIQCSPTVIQDRCFLAGCDGKLHVINLDNGKEVDAVVIGSPTGATPAASGDLIYFGTHGGAFLCVNWREAKEVWQKKNLSRGLPILSSAALTDKGVIFGGDDKQMHALDLNGETLWNFPTKGHIAGSPVVVGDRVFFGSADGRIYGIDLKSGQKAWDGYDAGGKFISSPAVADGKLVIASDRGVVYCFGEKKDEPQRRGGTEKNETKQ